MKTIQMHLSQKQNLFSGFFSACSKSTLNFEHSPNNRTLIASVFLKLRTVKHVPR